MASVSCDRVGPNKYKLRWREWVIEDGERRRVARSKTVVGKDVADDLRVTIRQAVDTVGYYEPEARPEEEVCNLEQAAAAWMRFKAARGAADTTIKVHASVFRRFFKAARKANRIADDEIVPSSVMTRDLMTEALIAWKTEGISEQRAYEIARTVYNMWKWAADDQQQWPGLARPPRDSSNVLPPSPIRTPAGIGPSWVEMDAVLRRSRSRRTRDFDKILATCRYTGLRIGQVLGIRVGDIDIDKATLRVRVGKSKREKAEQRVIPVSRHLVALLEDRLRCCVSDDYLFPAPIADGKREISAKVVRELFEVATEAGEIRRDVWEPPNRTKARTTHAFRSCLLTELRRKSVPTEVRHALVGHQAATTEEMHYAGSEALFGAMRAAVDDIPPIDWTGPGEMADNVVALRG